MTDSIMNEIYNQIHPIIIIGSGPAAHTAAIYAARAELTPILFEGFMAGGVAAGGQLTTTTDIENFPGFPEGLNGTELMERMRKQSLRFGTKIFTKTISKIHVDKNEIIKIWTEEDEKENNKAIQTKSLILATGATAKTIPIKGKDIYWQKGISACAVCDGALPIFRNQTLVVVGGGDTACEEASFLTKFASKVVLVHRRDALRASQIMQKRIFENKKIEIIWNSEVIEAMGDDTKLKKVIIKNTNNSSITELEAGGLFFAIGHAPNTNFIKGLIDLDKDGYVIVKPGTTQTNIKGIFACGDVQDKRYRQAITAAGTGCMAALEAEHFLAEKV